MEDLTKKRKHQDTENEGFDEQQQNPSEEELKMLLNPLGKEQLLHLLVKLGSQYPSVAEEIKSVASTDPIHRKLFVRGLAWDTASETLCTAFRAHGEIEEGAVVVDKATGKSRGYGFITYKHMESTQRALKEPSKLIDGRMAVCNLACEGLNSVAVTPDQSQRKLYIGGLSPDITSDILLNFFGKHGEIEEGSVTYEKDSNKSRGFGFVTYKTVEATRKAIDDPSKILGGRNITVKLADNQKGRTLQTQVPAAIVQLPIAMPVGYSQPGKAHVMNAPVGYSAYPQAFPTHPMTAFPNAIPTAATRSYSAVPAAAPTGPSGYSYYMAKQQ